MHDVVAHSLTVMISLSDGAAVVVRKNPDRAGEVLGELSRTGRTALADMRRVLGVLRDDAPPARRRGAAGVRRQPGEAAGGFRTAGLPLHYSHTGPALPDDAAFQLTVYRIVQESLTNVLRYGRSLSRVDVGIVRDGSTVTIDVLDDGRGTGTDRRAVRQPGTGTGPCGNGGAGPDLRRHGGGRARRRRRLARAGGRCPDAGAAADRPDPGHQLQRQKGERMNESDIRSCWWMTSRCCGWASASSWRVRTTSTSWARPPTAPRPSGRSGARPRCGADGCPDARAGRHRGHARHHRFRIRRRIIILTTFDLDEYAFAGLQAGASAFLLKDVAPAELIQAVRVVASGDAVVAPRVTQRLLETYVRGADPLPRRRPGMAAPPPRPGPAIRCWRT